MPLLYPLIAWGDADDLDGWQDGGTPVVTTGQTDPFGGTDAFLVNDDDGAGIEALFKPFAPSKDGRQWVDWFLKAGTAAVTDFSVFTTTGSLVRVRVRATWTAGVPTLSILSGSGATLTPILVGNGWYLIRFAADGVVASDGTANQIKIFPAGLTASATGTVLAYRRSSVILDVLDDVVAYPVPRDGSDWVQGPSGTEDAWITGTDYHLDATIRHVPASNADGPPIAKSGWSGAEEHIGVNAGVGAMLTAGRDKATLRFCPDRTDVTDYIDGYLVEPMGGPPGLEGNLERTVRIGLRGSIEYAGYV